MSSRFFCMTIMGLLFVILLSPLLASSSLALSPAPDFTLTDIDGNTFSLHDFRGKAVLIDFFATWCGPCIMEMPELKDIQGRFLNQCQIISISVDPYFDSESKLRAFRDDNQMTWIVARDTIDLSSNYNIAAIPTLYVINHEGNILSSHVGYTEASVLEDEITQAIPEITSFLALFLVATATTALALARTKRRRKNRGQQEILSHDLSSPPTYMQENVKPI